jgi:hypothetical protein
VCVQKHGFTHIKGIFYICYSSVALALLNQTPKYYATNAFFGERLSANDCILRSIQETQKAYQTVT